MGHLADCALPAIICMLMSNYQCTHASTLVNFHNMKLQMMAKGRVRLAILLIIACQLLLRWIHIA